MLARSALLFFLLFAFSTGVAQTWGQYNARWTYDYFDFCQQGKVQWTVVGDTVIQENSCQVFRKDYEIKSCSLDVTNTGSYQLMDIMYEKNGVVYWYNPELEIFDTLFWFGAAPGQTWSIVPTELYPGEILYLVTDTSSAVINGMIRKVLNVQYEIIGSSFGYDDILIEGIGPTMGYMKAWDVLEGAIDGPHEGNSFVCFYDDEIGDYKIQQDAVCDIVLSGDHLNPGQKLTIFPNPVRDKLFISEAVYGEVILFNSLDRRIRQTIENGCISVIDLAAGYYWVSIPESRVNIPFIKVE